MRLEPVTDFIEKRLVWTVGLCLLCLSVPGFSDDYPTLSREPGKYLSDDDLPQRTAPIIELGADFLGTGNIEPGFTLPTGAVWSPSLWVYGTFRSAYQTYRGAQENAEAVVEWANRLDLFANLQLTGTERILLGLTPLHDRDNGQFTGEIYEPDVLKESIDETNTEIDTFFFEGDFAELFPNIDYFDSTPNDIGFSIGRQQILFMDGFMVNDSIDGFGLSKNNIRLKGFPHLVNWRSSLFVGIDEIERHTNDDIDDSKLVGWFNQLDTSSSTYNVDMVYVTGEDAGDLLNIGGEAIQRFGKLNSAFRVVASKAIGDVTQQSDNGMILFAELSWVPSRTHDNIYANAFVAIDDYTSAARGPLTGGVLGRTGILYAAQGIGTYPAPLSNNAQRASGLTLGYQKFFKSRTQIVIEAGARFENRDELRDEHGVALRIQQAIGRRAFIQIDGYTTWVEDLDDTEYGSRIELQVKL
ncbi:hypothetical protein A9Q99_17525 [Gammaproteobacteria bacterium 45_16_T64]|mgnify:CR=1 FL=1|nr:hypothetical protein A9Q99_17525 [Gammaproteobacteria bacterium 45_16_T64]